MRQFLPLLLTTMFIPVKLPAAEADRDLASLRARPAPEWVTRGVMYQIQPRAFTPEGTLKAATARLAKVAEIGVDVIYMCPVFVSDDDPDRKGWSPRQKASGMNNPRNPYRMKDYYHVDPEYGTDDDLKAFVAEAHKLKMRVLLDMVYLHCGPNAVFLKEHPNFVKRDKDGKVVVAGWGFPAVNLANPELREYLWKNMEYWVRDFDVDGFRGDVSDGIPLDFWETARDRLEKILPDICLLAEGRRKADQVKAFDLNYSFTWFGALRRVVDKGEPVSSLRKTWEKIAAERPRGARFIRYIDNHDIANDSFHNRIEKAWGTERVNLMLVTMFTLDGMPMLYNGQEVADTARHSIFGRSPIDWATGNTPTGKERLAFCKKLCEMRHQERALTDGSLTWLDNDQPDSVLSFLRCTSAKSVSRDHVQRPSKAVESAGSTALEGRRTTEIAPPDSCGTRPDETIVVLNLSNHPIKVRVTLPERKTVAYETRLGHKLKVDMTEGSAVLRLGAFGYMVAKRR